VGAGFKPPARPEGAFCVLNLAPALSLSARSVLNSTDRTFSDGIICGPFGGGVVYFVEQ